MVPHRVSSQGSCATAAAEPPTVAEAGEEAPGTAVRASSPEVQFPISAVPGGVAGGTPWAGPAPRLPRHTARLRISPWANQRAANLRARRVSEQLAVTREVVIQEARDAIQAELDWRSDLCRTRWGQAVRPTTSIVGFLTKGADWRPMMRRSLSLMGWMTPRPSWMYAIPGNDGDDGNDTSVIDSMCTSPCYSSNSPSNVDDGYTQIHVENSVGPENPAEVVNDDEVNVAAAANEDSEMDINGREQPNMTEIVDEGKPTTESVEGSTYADDNDLGDKEEAPRHKKAKTG
ncbi:hypothetical protein CYMTET_40887 [Cymbomonas tetramitiformis]|uniref:Uncharacterized protein n=1 Tax=Cymbomonas tetramitiformis TaxID=36881 RepID=A0AAE0C8X9_9CHLO|nr:hypothetical protein CYMTET_40887 [Cymbomonas tetramitiformis]